MNYKFLSFGHSSILHSAIENGILTTEKWQIATVFFGTPHKKKTNCI